ncbi:MAG TPA: pyridoxal 5'-phosphate synthase glutaminase subunit PdxT [Acidimicrobiales bacterium]|nr:pyridoxal 5'-phosphate synthase glutaminase subunit PdxT [Acidimicrobiales bacterium]
MVAAASAARAPGTEPGPVTPGPDRVAPASDPVTSGPGPVPSGCHPVIGVLDLQGDVREHLAALHEIGATGRRVKRPEDLDGIDGLILPGGESTTLSMLLESTGLYDAIAQRLNPDATAASTGTTASLGTTSSTGITSSTSDPRPLPVLGTCAGTVLLASEVLDGRPDQRFFGSLDAVVRRNGYGRQAQSFEVDVVFGSGEGPPLPTVFIRAPLVVSVGDEVEVLATLDGVPVLVRQGQVLASSFHPELTPDRRVHRLFAEMCCSDAPGGLFGSRPG